MLIKSFQRYKVADFRKLSSSFLYLPDPNEVRFNLAAVIFIPYLT